MGALPLAKQHIRQSLWSSDGSSAGSQRKGNYFRAELPVDSTSAARWLTLTNLAVLNNGTHADIVATSVGHEFLPQTPEHFTCDGGGSLTNDGRCAYTWDAENRLVQLAPNTSAGSRNSIKFEYDWQGRRIHKQVWGNTSWSSTPTNDVKFVYDGWNLIAELDALNASTLLRSYVWGLDLSGSPQGAGGVGGLLQVTYSGDQTTNCFVAFDGNGNVAALADAGSTNLLAQYEYGPFGEFLRATGPMAKANPFRFSTKYQDDESDLVYYGLRYLKASTGGWLSRDPVGERGGPNAYGFIANDPVNDVDVLGLLAASVVSVEYSGHGSAEKNGNTSSQYVVIDNLIKGQVPLNVSDSQPAASITATLDDSFNADIRAWTMLSRAKSITSLQMSTFLNGTIKVCCPCPFKKVRANWSVSAALSGTAGMADASFDNRGVITAWNKPAASKSGTISKELNGSYCTTFSFQLGQGWTDTSKSTPTTSHVNVHASFECTD